MHEVFISLSRNEQRLGEVIQRWVKRTFAKHQITAFLFCDPKDGNEHAEWLANLRRALNDAELVISLISPTSRTRPWINIELGAAWIKDLRVVSICHSGQSYRELHAPLAQFVALDTADPNFELHLRENVSSALKVPPDSEAEMTLAAQLSNVIAGLRESKVRKFFGSDLATAVEGQDREFAIYLQSDEMGHVLSTRGRPGYGIDAVIRRERGREQTIPLEALLDSSPAARMYKAREWVNRFDAAGARTLCRAIRDLTESSPEIETSGHVTLTAQSIPTSKRGMAAYMGLGFTDGTKDHLWDVCAGWAECDFGESLGDYLKLAGWVLEGTTDLRSKGTLLTIDPTGTGWSIVAPAGWRSPKKCPAKDERLKLNDYAVILRHTLGKREREKVVFVCGGFTERSTFHAAQYLAHQWEDLQALASAGDNGRFGWGDFFAVISGVSNHRSEWTNLEIFITPERLVELQRRSPGAASFIQAIPRWVTRWTELEVANVGGGHTPEAL